MSQNPYLSGNFAPVEDELSAVDLPVTGELPPGLCGRLLRIGPNPVDPGPTIENTTEACLAALVSATQR